MARIACNPAGSTVRHNLGHAPVDGHMMFVHCNDTTRHPALGNIQQKHMMVGELISSSPMGSYAF